MNFLWKHVLSFLLLLALTVWLAVYYYPEPNLHIIACDVGQGDAILAVYGKTQILIDGGPDNKVLDCLSKYMPFWDRKIELVVLTHPQNDHFAGLIEVFKRYNVGSFLANTLESGSQDYQVLKDMVGGDGTDVINPISGMVLRLGMIYLDILHPSEEFLKDNGKYLTGPKETGVLGSYTSKLDPNDFSIVTILRLGDFDALLTGDIGPKVIDEVLTTGRIKDVEYIKIPHHGSKNGITKNLLRIAQPKIAIISVGKKNRYGHPHKEVLNLLINEEVKILRTDLSGNIEVVSDGQKYWIND